MGKTIIMISGKAGSGKDTVSDYLVKTKQDIVKLAFAGALKEYVGIKYGVSDRLLYTQEGKRQVINVYDEKMTVRELLIYEANVKRLVDDLYWVNSILEKIKNVSGDAVISDFRYPCEYNEMKRHYTRVLTINVLRDYKFTECVEDPSEYQLENFKFDFTVYNNSSKEDMYSQIDFIYNYFMSQ